MRYSLEQLEIQEYTANILQIKLSLETSLNNIDSFNDERKDVTDCLKGKGRCSLRIKLILNLNTDNKNKIS